MDNGSVGKFIGLKSEMNGITSNSNVFTENSQVDKIYRENGKLFFEGYDGNGNKFVSEIPDLPNQHYVDDNDDVVVQDNSEDNINPDDDPVMKNKKIYSELSLTPETMVYI